MKSSSILCAITSTGKLFYQIFSVSILSNDYGGFLIDLLHNFTEIR